MFNRTSKLATVALALSTLVQLNLNAQTAPAYTPLTADQLDQLVAPIALYPDSLVSELLVAATYPNQVSDAGNFVDQNQSLSPDQLAAEVNGMSWDPSVKGLAQFPSVLDTMQQNSGWTTQLGNAYYNQPDDVMAAIQAMRYQAQQNGQLASTPQQTVANDQGAITIVPTDPSVLAVPVYNPWRVFGGMIAPLPGFMAVGVQPAFGVAFDAPIGIAPFAAFGWGVNAWAPNFWGGGGVFLRGSDYVSRSMTVRNAGRFGRFNNGAFARGGRGVPSGFRNVPRISGANLPGRDRFRNPVSRVTANRIDTKTRAQGGDVLRHGSGFKPGNPTRTATKVNQPPVKTGTRTNASAANTKNTTTTAKTTSTSTAWNKPHTAAPPAPSNHPASKPAAKASTTASKAPASAVRPSAPATRPASNASRPTASTTHAAPTTSRPAAPATRPATNSGRISVQRGSGPRRG